MYSFLIIIIVICLVEFLLKNFLKSSVHQLNIMFLGFNSIPAVLLQLANLNYEQNIRYRDLTNDERKAFSKTLEKVSCAVQCSLTYINSHGLIHVQKQEQGYFNNVSKDDRYLIREEIGKFKDGDSLSYVLYRKDNGLIHGSKLIGCLIKNGPLGMSKQGEVASYLFEFPERLIWWRFLTRSLQNKYGLKEDVAADYLDKDELGFSQEIYNVSFETSEEETARITFYIH